jgi:hypothetical protein
MGDPMGAVRQAHSSSLPDLETSLHPPQSFIRPLTSLMTAAVIQAVAFFETTNPKTPPIRINR